MLYLYNGFIIKIVLCVILATFFAELHPQENRSLDFKSFTRAYNPLDFEQANIITSQPLAWEGAQPLDTIPIGFNLNWAGKTYDKLEVQGSGNMLFLSPACYSKADDRYYSISVGLLWAVEDRAYFDVQYNNLDDTAYSPVHYQNVINQTSDEKLIIEWRDVTTRFNNTDSIDFQIIIYKEEPKIEFHFGKMILHTASWDHLLIGSSSAPPMFGFNYNIDCDNLETSKIAILKNDGESPDLIEIDWENFDPLNYDNLIHTPPAPGTVWQFKLRNTTSVEEVQSTEDDNLTVYPNPSSGGVFHINTAQTVERIAVYEVATGKEVPFYNMGKSQFKVDGNGIYILTVQTESGLFREKLVVVD